MRQPPTNENTPASLEPAKKALDEVAACLGDLVQRFGSLAERDGGEEEEVDSGEAFGGRTRDHDRALRAEIGDLKAANRIAEERIAALEQALADAGEENDGLRREKHRLQQRLAAIDGAGDPFPTEDETVPALENYGRSSVLGGAALSGTRGARRTRTQGAQECGIRGRGSRRQGDRGAGGKLLADEEWRRWQGAARCIRGGAA